MQISDDTRKILVDEINFVVKKMQQQEASMEDKLYFFTAIHGMFHRIANLEFDPELVLAHLVLARTHSTIIDRLAAIMEKREKPVRIPDKLFDALIATTKELAKRIKKDDTIYDVLQRFAILGFVTTGNGYYLYERGKLSI